MIISNIKCQGIVMVNQGFVYVSNWRKSEKLWQINKSCERIIDSRNREGNGLNQLYFRDTYTAIQIN